MTTHRTARRELIEEEGRRPYYKGSDGLPIETMNVGVITTLGGRALRTVRTSPVRSAETERKLRGMGLSVREIEKAFEVFEQWKGGLGALTPQPPSSGLALQDYATRYKRVHAHGDRIEYFDRGCFAATLAKKRNVSVLREHDWGRSIGSTAQGSLELAEDENGLAFRLHVHEEHADTRSLLDAVRRHEIFQCSVGYAIVEEEQKTIAGQTVRVMRNCQLDEISIVRTPAVKEATFALIDTRSALPSATRSPRRRSPPALPPRRCRVSSPRSSGSAARQG